MFSEQRRNLFRLSLSFFLFGLINNVLYVIILSAALDLVPPSTPKGIIAFWNITPSIVAKFSWPYILKGRIRYARRLIGCCFLSVTGMIVVASSAGLSGRLFGIGCASLASGLGELTFLQLSTTFHPPSVAGRGVGYFASGTGAAGLVGAFLWWEIRGLGVRIGVGLSSVLPLVIPLTYFLLLPRPHAFSTLVLPEIEEFVSSRSEYAQLPALSIGDKWQLLKPMIPRYMMPLFFVYLFEYTINQGVAPTLIYPIPTLESSPVFGRIVCIFHLVVYLTQSHCISLSLISFPWLPALPTRAIPIPSIIQGFLLITLSSESALGYFPESLAPGLVFLLISLEGICGGLSYVNAYFHGAIGLADSLGILAASLVAMPTEISLCRAQVARGRSLCQEL
ncbi:batten's disease protein Cln3 [Russula vinacea]|nr:batten's disease protein Cln3 [Russula vinacea]